MRKLAFFFLVLLLFIPAMPANAQGQGGNIPCPAGYSELKFETPVANGTYGLPEDPRLQVTFTIYGEDGAYLDWSANFIVHQVIVKGSNDATVHPGGMSGSGLTAPVNPNNGKFPGISNFRFCYKIEPSLSMTAWAETVCLPSGDTLATFKYTVTNTGNVPVFGVNGVDLAVGASHTYDGGTETIPPGGSVTKDFSASGEVAGFTVQASASATANARTDCAPAPVCEWKGETAWGAGNRYVTRGNWATFTPYVSGATVTLFAGQTMPAGTVTFGAIENSQVKITVTLNSGWRFANVLENLKIQGYSSAPSGNPSPGLFANKFTVSTSTIEVWVPEARFYGVHADVEWERCY